MVYKVRERQVLKYSKPKKLVVQLLAEKMPRTRNGWVGLHLQHHDVPRTTVLAIMRYTAQGFRYVAWDGRRLMGIIDRKGRILGSLAGRPAGDLTWDDSGVDAYEAMARARGKLKLGQDQLTSRRTAALDKVYLARAHLAPFTVPPPPLRAVTTLHTRISFPTHKSPMANNTRSRNRKANSVSMGAPPKNTKGQSASTPLPPAHSQTTRGMSEPALDAQDGPTQPPISPLSDLDDMDVEPTGGVPPSEGDETPPLDAHQQSTHHDVPDDPFMSPPLGRHAEGTALDPGPTPAMNGAAEKQPSQNKPQEENAGSNPPPATTPGPNSTGSQAPPTPKMFFGGEDTSNMAPGAREHFTKVQEAQFTFQRTEHFDNAPSVGLTPDGEVRFVSDTSL
ncbi:hypothetical protein FA95DRAFT_1614118 [Auriscalpium vulgare]|uniref:Uncharacterized protein n=1 Tax=Auriscalpium vulgare TaxID=40419 RepID=A0ACB8R0M5_9AGAM|nr:hypothetical protein FA95DRAFT_1614118 [Auriscalpium vulgare]